MDKIKNFFRTYYAPIFSKNGLSLREKYGLKSGTFEEVATFVAVLALSIGVGYLSKLSTKYLIILAIAGILISPIIYISLMNQQAEQKRFTMVSEYLTNIIPLFMQKTKILLALREVCDLVDIKMRTIVNKAIESLEDDGNEKNAFKFIEDEFPNSRITAVHRLMTSIEHGNSIKFRDTCMLMYEDIDAWINRVGEYQKDLKNRKSQIMVLIGLTIGMNVMFTYMYSTSEAFNGFTDKPAYQITTTLFLIVMLIMAALVIAKLHGKWIVDDMSYLNKINIKDIYDKQLEKGDTVTKSEKLIPLVIIVLGVSICLIIPKMLIVGAVLSFFGTYLFVSVATASSSRKKAISKYLTVEFPMWLREISISLGNYTVLNAINESKKLFSYALQKEVDDFVNKAMSDPTSIKPYNEFLEEYGIDGATASMKVLYSIQNLGAKETESQVAGLITRNQKMLAKSEEIKNKGSIAGIELLGFAPMAVFTTQTLINMVLMMSQLMSYMQSQMVF